VAGGGSGGGGYGKIKPEAGHNFTATAAVCDALSGLSKHAVINS